MRTSTAIRKILYHIYAIIQALFNYPQVSIDNFVQGHLNTLYIEPVTPEHQIMIDRVESVFVPYDTVITKKNSDAGQQTTAIAVIKDSKTYIITQLNDIEHDIDTITHNDLNVKKEFRFNQQSLYYDGRESEILRYFKELKFNVAANPLYASVLPKVTTFVNTINAKYGVKFGKKTSVKQDITDLLPLVDPLVKALLLNFYELGIENIDNQSAITGYFPYIEMDLPVKNKEILASNQFNAIGMQGSVVNLIDVKQEFGSWIEADCRKCAVDVDLWLASEITSVVPLNAQRICKGDRLIFKNSTIGSSTEMYLMAAFAEDVTVTEECKFKITIDKKKPNRKNIISPKVAIVAPIVVPPVVETPAKVEEPAVVETPIIEKIPPVV